MNDQTENGIIASARQIIINKGKFTPRDIGRLAHENELPFCVTCWLLEIAGVLPRGTYIRIVRGGLTVSEIMREVQP